MEDIKYNEWTYEFYEDEENDINSYIECRYYFDNENYMYYTMYRDYSFTNEIELGVRIQSCNFAIMGEEYEYDREDVFINSLGDIDTETNQYECGIRDWMMKQYEENRAELGIQDDNFYSSFGEDYEEL